LVSRDLLLKASGIRLQPSASPWIETLSVLWATVYNRSASRASATKRSYAVRSVA
jgi:hypothetical protein